MLCVWDVCDLDKDAQEIGLENATGWAMIWDPSSTQVSHVIFQPSLGSSLEVISLVKVIWLRRVRSYVKNDEECV
jgi:hypothetical protein